MRRYLYIFMLSMLMMACQKEDDFASLMNDHVITGEVFDLTSCSVTLDGFVNDLTNSEYATAIFGVMLVYADDVPTTPQAVFQERTSSRRFSNYTEGGFTMALATESYESRYTLSIDNLDAGRKVYYCSFIVMGTGVVYMGDIKSFVTTKFNPGLKTGAATDVGFWGATISATFNLTDIEASHCEFGFVYSYTTTQPKCEVDSTIYCAPEKHYYGHTFVDMVPGVKYYYRAFIKHWLDDVHYEFIYANTTSFTTPVNSHNPTTVGAECQGMTVTFNGSAELSYSDMKTCTYGFVYSSETNMLSYDNDEVITFKSDANFKGDFSVTKDLYYNTTFYYRAFVREYTNDGYVVYYGALKSVKTDVYKAEVGQAVDLGLSVKWADRNLGATSAEDDGGYFAWAEIVPKGEYRWSNYRHCDGDASNINKYCVGSFYGSVDDRTMVESSDDALSSLWSNGWRLPTTEEFEELIDKCEWTWTVSGSAYGYRVVGPSGNAIFMPASGYRDVLELYGHNQYGHYWSSELNVSNSSVGGVLYMYSTYQGINYYKRCYGYTVRGVK